MFGIGLVIALALLELYVFSRAARLPWLARVPRRSWLAVGGGLLALFALGRFVGHGGAGAVAAALELAGMTWLGTLALTAAALFAVDVVTGFGWLGGRLVPWLRAAGLGAGLVLSGVALHQGLSAPIVRSYEVRLAGLPPERDGTVLVVLSDLHVGSILGEAWLGARVAQVQALRPDAVLLLGDIVEGHGAPDAAVAARLAELHAPLGVWAVLGNHEAHGGGTASVGLFERAGVGLLRNESVAIAPGLVLAGIDDAAGRRPGADSRDLDRALAGRPGGAAILLSHKPWHAERAAAAGVGLMLAGHTHGGQLWPLSYLVALASPLVAGRYEVGDMTVLVSRGAGTWGMRMRLWEPGEILKVTLHPR